MDTAPWPQEIGLVKPMEELVSSATTSTSTINRPQLMGERRARPQKEQALNCPRCNSTNTKFCYYNNYSLTQPRYFCKTCRRYWTEGGSLRNVPVGGGSRKNKRSSSSSSTATATSTSTTTSSTVTAVSPTVSTSRKLLPELTTSSISISTSSQNPRLIHEGQDLNLAFPHHSLPEFSDFPNLDSSSSNNNNSSSNGGSNPCTAVGALSAMELLRSGMGARELGPFVPMAMPEYPAGFGIGLQEFRPPTLGFPLDGVGGAGGGTGGGGGGGGLQGVQESAGGRLLFPFENLRPVLSSTAAEFEQNRGQDGDPPGFWNGMMGGGGTW